MVVTTQTEEEIVQRRRTRQKAMVDIDEMMRNTHSAKNQIGEAREYTTQDIRIHSNKDSGRYGVCP